MLQFYQWLMRALSPLLCNLLDKRVKAGKEDVGRLSERKGRTDKPRPKGVLYWVHAASVGEAQSSKTLISALLERDPELHILATTGTLTSAKIMAKTLPPRAFHQFYPLDHPDWTNSFLDHWRPDAVFWMESELWPNMLGQIKARNIPATLVNARLSPQSYKKWRYARPVIKKLLASFNLILCQTDRDENYFNDLGAPQTHVTDNLKYSAAPLGVDKEDLQKFNDATMNRPCWVYASSHKGEEELVARTHQILKRELPDLLSIIIPRHPERRDAIVEDLKAYDLGVMLRGEAHDLPSLDTDIYIADTLGELGLFYRACPIAIIGRSFSDDGGGGHNPIEAAQLHCATLHGPNVQNLQDIFDEMNRAGAAKRLIDADKLADEVLNLLQDETALKVAQDRAVKFAADKARVLPRVMAHIDPILQRLDKGGAA
jgi:3-deoxy-D-manno-octulosonic-acid transferase